MKKIIIYFFFISTINYSQKIDIEIFNYLDLLKPGLENVAQFVSVKEYDLAQKELLNYFQNRSNRIANFINEDFPTNSDQVMKNINNIFNIKNYEFDFGNEIDWKKIHKDKEWQYSLGRMNWFNNYIGVYLQTKDEKIISSWMSQILSWINLNNPGYPRTIDSGRRLENFIKTYWIFVQVLKAKTVTPEFNSIILKSMYEQAEFLYRPENWRKYSNWGTFENNGLTKLAILFPEFKRSNDWLKESFFRMRTQLNNSFYNDGMHIETSPSYHSHELEVLFDFYELAALNEIEELWSPQNYFEPIKEIILRNAKALMHLYKPTGYYPQLGDTDKRDESILLYKIGKFYEDSELVYFGSKGEEGKKTELNSITFPQGGYTVLRSEWSEYENYQNDLHLIFDSGLNKPWHAHFDILNVIATAFGKEILIDPGRYTYNDGPERE